MDEIRIQLKFTEPTPYGDFRSALYFTMEEWEASTPEQREAMKQEQVAAYIHAVENPVVEVVDERTEEQKYQDDMNQRARDAGLL